MRRLALLTVAISILLGALVTAPVRADEPAPDPPANRDRPAPSSEADPAGEIDAPADPKKVDQLVKDAGDATKHPRPDVPDPAKRGPSIDLPKDAVVSPSQGQPKSPLVKVNKSAVRPQVLKRPKGAGSVKGMGLTFKTNLQTGSASVGLPFQLPPARRGLGPGLGLSYSSSGAQGVAGLGWSLGIGFIARQTDQGLPRYDDQIDRFVYNGGRELVRVDPGSEPLPPWADRNHYYRAKIEGLFWRFFLIAAGTPAAHWVAQDTNGTLYYFGATEDGTLDQNALLCDGGCLRIFRWNLVMVVDVHGNEVRYICAKHDGQAYLTDVLYNNHPTQDRYQHRVVISYEGRDDALTSYQPGFPVATAQRVREVAVYTDYGYLGAGAIDDGDGRRLVRRYALRYVAESLHSLLEEVQLFGSDGQTALPPVRFDYTAVSGAHAVPQLGHLDGTVLDIGTPPGDSLGDGRRDLLDVDGDGLPDVYETDPANPGGLGKYLLNTGAAFDGPLLPMGGVNNLYLYNSNVRLMDVDGDGLADMMHMPTVGSYSLYRSGCDPVPAGETGASRTCAWSTASLHPANPDIDLTTDAAEIKLVDVNGDHLIDVVRTAGTQMEHFLNLSAYEGGEGRFGRVLSDGTLSDAPITSCVLHRGTPVSFSDPRVKLADMNGDGLQDIVLADYGDLVYWPNQGWGVWGEGGACAAGTFGGGREIVMANAPYYSSLDPTKVYLGDVNGDGLADMVQVRANAVDVWLNAVSEFKARAIIPQSPWAPQFTDRVRLADMNGSGSRDILWGDGGQYRYIDLTGGIKPRLLYRIENGLGAVTEISYGSSTDQYLLARDEGREWTTTCPFPSQVVTGVVTSDQFQNVGAGTFPEGRYVTSYRYYDCLYDGDEHEHRGFAEVTEEKVGDTNSPTSYVTHHFYQGIDDEALAGKEWRTDVWAYDAQQSPYYLSTTFTSYAVRTVKDAHPTDLEPGRPVAATRRVRFTYAAESHSFGYDTTAYSAGPHSKTGLLLLRFEDPDGANPSSSTIDLELPAASGKTTHIKSSLQVDDLGQATKKTAHGRPGVEGDPIEQHVTYVANQAAWIHRACESWTQQGIGGGAEYFNRTVRAYDGADPDWGTTLCAGGGTTCSVGSQGLPTTTELEECYEGSRVRLVTAQQTSYTDFGLPSYTEAFKKLESWLHYEDPRGYQALVTREVLRVGTAAATLDYPETDIKTLSTRVEYDVGFGLITEYRDENGHKTRAVYDALGRIVEMWTPREPYGACGDGSTPVELKQAELEYHLVPGGAPYSYVYVKTVEDACDPTNQVDHTYAYVDGLGRARLTVKEGDPGASAPKTAWIASGYLEYDAKGAAKVAYEPAYVAWTPGVDAPQPVAANCPTTDDDLGDDVVCTTQTAYDPFGRAITVTLADGATTKTEYRGPLETWAYDANDSDSTSNFYDTPAKTRKDGWGRTIETEVIYTDPAGANQKSHYTRYDYDAAGNLTDLRTCNTGDRWQSDGGACATADEIVKVQRFDSLSQRREIQDPDAGTWKFIYDESGNLIESRDGKHTASAGASGNKISYTYDAANRLIVEKCVECELTGDGVVLVRYFYDSPPRTVNGQGLTPAAVADEPMDNLLGRLSWIEDETGSLWFSYDGPGRQKTEIQQIEATLQSLGTAGGAAVFISRTEYDDASRVTKLVYPGPTSEPSLVVQHAYNARGLLDRIYGPDTFDTQSTYDYAKSFQYNAPGQLRTMDCGQAAGGPVRVETTKHYDRRRRLKKVERVEPATPFHELQKLEYHYDPASNLLGIHDYRDTTDVSAYTAAKNNPYDLQAEYDALYRLTKATYRDSGPTTPIHTGALRREMRYAYDAVGNLTKRETTDKNSNQNPAGEFYTHWIGTLTYGAGTAGPHAVTGGDGGDGAGGKDVAITYDGNGNMLELTVTDNAGSVTVYDYLWDHYDRLVQVIKTIDTTEAARAEHAYDFGGDRVIRSEDKGTGAKDTLYPFNGLEIRNTSYERYVYRGDQRLARIGVNRPIDGGGTPSETRLLYVADHLGSSTLMVEDSGDTGASAGCVVSTTSHLPYGALEAESAAELCSGRHVELWARFTGKELEKEYGLYYFGARYLNPHLGRWVSVDPKALFSDVREGSYRYVANRPYGFVDPDGLKKRGVINKAKIFFGKAIGGMLNLSRWVAGPHRTTMYRSTSGQQRYRPRLNDRRGEPHNPGRRVRWIEKVRRSLRSPGMTKAQKNARAGRWGPVLKGVGRDAVIEIGVGKILKGLATGVRFILKWRHLAKQDWAKMSGMLRDAATRKGNFGIGSATRRHSDKMGKTWVGKGYQVASDGKTLVSKDGLRQYRPPSFKPNLNKTQANFERRIPGQQSKQWQGNAHLDIID